MKHKKLLLFMVLCAIAPIAVPQQCVSDPLPCTQWVYTRSEGCSTMPYLCCAYREAKCVGSPTFFRWRLATWGVQCENYGSGFFCPGENQWSWPAPTGGD